MESKVQEYQTLYSKYEEALECVEESKEPVEQLKTEIEQLRQRQQQYDYADVDFAISSSATQRSFKKFKYELQEVVVPEIDFDTILN